MKLLADKVMVMTLLSSISIHALGLGIISGFPSKLCREKEAEIYEIVYLEMKKPPLLPEIDIMGKEKKIPQESDLKSVLEVEISNLVMELLPETEKKTKELTIEKARAESGKEEIKALKDQVLNKVEVLNPSEEAMLRYQDMVKQKIEAVRRYPLWAKKRGIKGRAHVSFIINSNGNCRFIELVKSSNSILLDHEAIATIKRANSFPPLPEGIARSYIQMDVDIVFNLQ